MPVPPQPRGGTAGGKRKGCPKPWGGTKDGGGFRLRRGGFARRLGLGLVGQEGGKLRLGFPPFGGFLVQPSAQVVAFPFDLAQDFPQGFNLDV